MGKSEVEGVPQEKLDRLWGHLMKVERVTGGKLAKIPRRLSFLVCPIENFAPHLDGKGRPFVNAGMILWYLFPNGHYKQYKPVYSNADSEWWDTLSPSQHIAITKWVIQKIKERDNEKN